MSSPATREAGWCWEVSVTVVDDAAAADDITSWVHVEVVECNSSVEVGGSMGSEFGLEELCPITGLHTPELSSVLVFFSAGPSSLFNCRLAEYYTIQ